MATKDEYLLVEMWEEREGRWEQLTREQRQDIIGQIQVGVGNLLKKGLVPVGFFVNDPTDVPGKHREHWRYVAVWRLPSKELLEEMLPQVDQLPKWFEVMHELRVWGRIRTPEEGAQILLGARPTIMQRLQPLDELGRSAKAIASIVSEKPTITERLRTLEEQQRQIFELLKQMQEQMPRAPGSGGPGSGTPGD